jgi:hypothetical protein
LCFVVDGDRPWNLHVASAVENTWFGDLPIAKDFTALAKGKPSTTMRQQLQQKKIGWE